MGHCNSKIVTICCISLFLLLSLILSFAFPTSTQDGDPQSQPDNARTGPFRIKKRYSQQVAFLNTSKKGGSKTDKIDGMKKNRRMKNRDHNNNNNNLQDARRFSAMLPKGYVPPSGSSPCHNVYPNSVAFFCHLLPDEMLQP